MGKDRLNRKIGYGLLAEFYAPLLTDRQQTLLELYCDEDLSLSEIASQMSISRQAVSDNLNRAYERLDELEQHLQLLSSFVAMSKRVKHCLELLNRVEASSETRRFLDEAIDTLLEDGGQKGSKDGI
ncbi:MAG: sigma factor-like helix-turn-helix DNA-binding protein [Christensenellales bacterium]